MGREFTKWLDFKYERLSDFCFYCGKLDHAKKYCHAYLQKCDESLIPPIWPYDILLRGKENSSEKPLPLRYPHALAITIVDLDLSDLSQGGQMMNPFMTQSISFAPFLNSNMASYSCLSALRNSQSIMIPTLINPNNSMDCVSFGTTCNSSYSMSHSSHLASISTDSFIVSDSLALTNPELVHATHSLAEALPSLALG
uniref:Zinc knuckle CX2CX4HX4C domain-containing protein n=1 Tax=Cannabis sativa TaxID=3483 RepID=A0A803QI78_CANSA